MLSKFVEETLRQYGNYPVIIFGSAVHGAGRSSVADAVAEAFRQKGYGVERISAGRFVRETAEEMGIDVNDLMRIEAEEPENFYRFNVKLDQRILSAMHTESEERIVIVDANLAAYYADMDTAFAFLVHTDLKTIGERLMRAKREGERVYKTTEDAIAAVVERTRADIRTYRGLSTAARDNFWKMIYRIGAEDMERMLKEVLRGNTPRSEFFNETVDNSGDLENTLKQFMDWVNRFVEKWY